LTSHSAVEKRFARTKAGRPHAADACDADVALALARAKQRFSTAEWLVKQGPLQARKSSVQRGILASTPIRDKRLDLWHFPACPIGKIA
jgi:hypothetical protein